MRPIGYSTGSLGKSDFNWALKILRTVSVTCVELSALRMEELPVLLEAIDDLDLSAYQYVSFHAPSRFAADEERGVTLALRKVRSRGWPIVVHPDVIKTPSLWRELGEAVCIENMDKRKPIGRNVQELEVVFAMIPEARFCFDIAHALQIDPTMSQAVGMLKAFRDRLCQVHISTVDSQCIHHPLHWGAVQSYKLVDQLIPADIPLILESPLVDQDADPAIEMMRELQWARQALPFAERRASESFVATPSSN